MILRVFSVLFTMFLAAGCSVKSGTMAPVEDRTGQSNDAANYGNQVVVTDVDISQSASTQAYKAPPVTAPVTAPRTPAPSAS